MTRRTSPLTCEAKKAYVSRKHAEFDARKLNRERRNGGHVGVYRCRCGHYHVGTQPPRRFGQALDREWEGAR